MTSVHQCLPTRFADVQETEAQAHVLPLPNMAVVILGCRAPNDVALPMMIRRVELGVKIYKDFQVSPVEHRNWKLILTGYKGSGQTLSEAAVMKVLALENGIDEENVLLEERARSTVENAYFTKLMIDELDINEIHVVSSEFHIPRSKVIFDTFFHEPTYTAHYHGALDSEQTKEERKKKEEYEMSMLHHNIHLCITDYGSRKKPLIFKSAMFSIEGLVHGFTSREGGVSRYKPLASLNLHFNPRRRDPKVCVRENYRRIAAAMELNVDAFHNPQAVHGRDIWVIGDSQPNSYDGIVTDRLGVVITAPGADCMPVLLCDPVRRVIGACHSGWRGTVLQIASHAVEIMKTRLEYQMVTY